jgi:PAS domain S-box-containing protein
MCVGPFLFSWQLEDTAMATKPTYEELEQKVKELEYTAIERKQTEEALHESEELFRNVYDTAPLAFVLWDLDTCVTDWNKKAEEVFGWSKEEALGHNFFGFLIPDKDRPQVQNVVDRLLKGELPSHSINDNLTRDGQIITCEWNNSPLHDDDGNIVGAISLALDITDRKRAEEAVREREATLESIFRAAPTGIGMVSERVLKRVNDRICEMTGYSREELLDQSARMLYPTDEDFEYVGTEKYAQIRERGIGTVETRWRRKDKSCGRARIGTGASQKLSQTTFTL